MDPVLFLPLIVVAIFSLTIGLLAGRLMASPRGSEEEAPEQDPAPEPLTPQPPDDALHIWVQPESKTLVLQIKDRLYQSGGDISPAERKYLVRLLTHFQNWLGEPLQKDESDDYESPVTAEAVDGPKLDPASVITSTLQPDVPAAAPKSIVEQIDEILQEKLIASPLRDRGIRLMETPQRGMVIIVGLDQYEDVDSVPDDEIKAMIRSAVSEWEKS